MLSLFVVRGEGQTLFGRDWLTRIELDWAAPAGHLGRPVPRGLESRLGEVPLLGPVPPVAPVPPSGPVPPFAPVPPSGPVPPFEPEPPSRPEGEVPVAGAAAIRRWCLFLASCDYDIRFRGNGDRADCDGLSRLPCTEGRGEHPCCDGLSRLPCVEGPTSSGSTNRLDVFALSKSRAGRSHLKRSRWNRLMVQCSAVMIRSSDDVVLFDVQTRSCMQVASALLKPRGLLTACFII